MLRKRGVVVSVALAAGAALVGVGAAVAQSGDTPAEHTNQGKSTDDHGLHKGWDKVIDHANNGKHKGWDQHGQHGGAPVTVAPTDEAPGQSGDDHGQAGLPHGKAGLKGKGAEKGQAGQDHGKAGDDHGKAGQKP
jgi:hypothetical protein